MWIKIGNRLIKLGDLSHVVIEDTRVTLLSKSERPLIIGTSVDCMYKVAQDKLDALKLGIQNMVSPLEI